MADVDVSTTAGAVAETLVTGMSAATTDDVVTSPAATDVAATVAAAETGEATLTATVVVDDSAKPGTVQ